ncbi:MAG: hypothetical protein ACQEVA_21540 [Myxococcota bacterium]
MSCPKYLFELRFDDLHLPGLRRRYTSPPTSYFWDAWQESKALMQKAGFRVFKSGDTWVVAFLPHKVSMDALTKVRRLNERFVHGEDL